MRTRDVFRASDGGWNTHENLEIQRIAKFSSVKHTILFKNSSLSRPESQKKSKVQNTKKQLRNNDFNNPNCITKESVYPDITGFSPEGK